MAIAAREIRFFDSNVLLYLASDDPRKSARAERLLTEGGTISVQVLNEIVHVLRRKSRFDWDEIRVFLRPLRTLLSVRPVTVAIHEAGLGLAARFGFSTFDAMIVASAIDAESDILWSEDMQDGLRVGDRLRIVNPFR